MKLSFLVTPLFITATLAIADPSEYAKAHQQGEIVTHTVALPVPDSRETATSQEKSERLAEAMRLAARGQDDEALALLKQIAAEDPARGFPALGRFLFLKQREADIESFRETLENADPSIDPVAVARGWNALGETEKAINLLSGLPDATEGARIDAAILLANLLRRESRHAERAAMLVKAMRASTVPANRVLLANELLRSHPAEFLDQPGNVMDLISLGLESAQPTRQQAIAAIDPLIIEIQQRPGYFEKREMFLKEGRERDAAAAWFATRLIIREENHAAALAYAESIENEKKSDPLWPLFAGEKAELLWALGKQDKARLLLDDLASATTGTEQEALLFKAAQVSLARKEIDRTLALIEQIDFALLPEEYKTPCWILYVTAAAETEDLGTIVDVYTKAVADSRREDYAFFHNIIFERILDTEGHLALEELIRQRFEEEPETAPELWLLASEAASNARRTPNQLEALYQYTKARPRDLQAIELLASVSTPLAIELASVSEEDIAAPDGEVERITHLSETALQALVKARPYDPAPLASLMELYEALGDSERAMSAAIELAQSSNDNTVLGAVAYMLARTGHPEEALRLYDKGLERDPHDMPLMVNRAACLTRLDRVGEARDFYKGLLENGYKGRSWHFHELLDRLWKIAEAEEDVEGYINYLSDVILNLPADRIREGCEDASAMLVHNEYFNEAEPYLQKLVEIASTREELESAYEGYLNACFKAKRYDRAEEIAQEALAAAESAESRIELEQVLAEISSIQGGHEAAVASLRSIAATYPEIQSAQFGLFRAAEIAGEAGLEEQSRQLYQEFLASDSTEFHYRNVAEERLNNPASDAD